MRKQTNFSWRFVPAAVALFLAGCAAVGPDHQRPAPTLGDAFVQPGSAAPNAQPVGADIATFWRGFNDPVLSALVDQAIAANTDVRIAQARLQEARAGLDEADAAGRPGLGISGSAERSVQPLTQRPGTTRSERTGTAYDASFIAQWEIDLFGGLRRASEAAGARLSASEAGLHAARTSVVAEVARTYLQLRGVQERLGVTEASLGNQREALRITQARVDAGRNTELDLARARGLVASTEAALPALQAEVERNVLRLATLTAQPPRALFTQLSTPQPLPSLPVTDLAALPVGTPQAWLQRRPDLIAAERQLAAATADIGVATASLYPRLTLSGLLGFNAPRLGDLFDSASARYAAGAGISWTPFDGGATRARIRASEARAQQALASFDQSVALALEETEGAFSAYTRNTERASRLDEASRQADEAARLARVRFDAGVTDFLAVLDAEREVLNNRDQLVQTRVGTAVALVNVYRALGGGWNAEEPVR